MSHTRPQVAKPRIETLRLFRNAQSFQLQDYPWVA